MIIVYILLAIALLITFLLSAKVKLFIIYDDSLTVYAKYLFFRYSIVPGKDKSSSKRKSKKKRKNNAPKKQSSEVQKPVASGKKNEKSIISKLFEVKEIIARFINKFFKKLHFKFIKLKIVVACENAAATALAYGAVTQGVSYILEMLNSVSTIETSKNSDISITSDFVSKKSEFQCNIELYARMLPTLIVGFSSFLDYAKHKSNTEE